MNLDIFWKDFDPDFYFLVKTIPLESHSDEIAPHIKYLYDCQNEVVKHRMATILNAIFSQGLQTFMLSKRSLDTLFKQDSLSKFSALGTKDYKLLLARMVNSNMFQVLRKPTTNKAGVYKLVHPELGKMLVVLIGQKMLEEQESKILNYYDDFDKHKKSLDLRETKEQRMLRIKDNIRNQVRSTDGQNDPN